MSFSNLEYLYSHLPARFRREDKDLFLKRYLQFFGETLDGYDAAFDSFFENINPATASETWIEFWLENLFGWSWFPEWFTVADKRRLFGNFARHLARRGTARGIELWLADFGISAQVHRRRRAWGAFVWGATNYAASEPLHLVVEIYDLQTPRADLQFWGAGVWGAFYYANPTPRYSAQMISELLRFVQPQAQNITILWRAAKSAQDAVQIVPGGATNYLRDDETLEILTDDATFAQLESD